MNSTTGGKRANGKHGSYEEGHLGPCLMAVEGCIKSGNVAFSAQEFPNEDTLRDKHKSESQDGGKSESRVARGG